jgi:phosphomevalonate kinase
LTELYEQDSTLYNETIASCAQLKSIEWSTVLGVVAEEIVQLVKDFNHVRFLLQRMSELSDVPVEPKEQTRLLDECTNVPGVAMAGVPGGK